MLGVAGLDPISAFIDTARGHFHLEPEASEMVLIGSRQSAIANLHLVSSRFSDQI